MGGAIEQHVDFISEYVDYMRAHDLTRIEPDAQHQQAWFERCNAIANATVLMDIDTWYNGANVEGKTKSFMFYAGGLPAYEQTLCQVVNDGYRGFEMV
jgi:cyclohexanone monooxygenase